MAMTNTAPPFAELGAVFNDATRLLEGDLWQHVMREGEQGFGIAASAAVNEGGSFGSVAAAESTLRSVHLGKSIVAALGQEITVATAATAAHTVATAELVSPCHAFDANVAGAHHHHLGHVWG